MFQGLTQGAILHILYRNEPRVVDGRVVSVNTHMPMYNPGQPMSVLNGPVTDITVQVGNDTIPFAGLPANGVVANFPDKAMFVAIDKSAILKEVEAMKSASKQIIDQIPIHEKMVKSCDELLLHLEPERLKEAQKEQEIEILKEQINAMNGKFDKVVEMLSVNLGNISKNKKD